MGRTRRDYASKPAPQTHPTPGWVWLLVGLLIGLFIAFLLYLKQGGVGSSDSKPNRPHQSVAKKQPAPIQKPSTEKKPTGGFQFDFYDYLPKMQVVIPEEELELPSGQTVTPSTYFLQVGSFRNAADADTRKAALGLLGLVSVIKPVKVEGKGEWHRVRLGPFMDRRKVDRIIRQLQENGIDFIMMKEKA